MGLQVQVFYEVELGDSLLDICLRFKINMARILELNTEFQELNTEFHGRDVNKIYVGELIRIQ